MLWRLDRKVKRSVQADGRGSVCHNQKCSVPLLTQANSRTVLARAFHWQELLDTGRYASVTALADALQLDRSYARRILTLATLAPDIVDAIVRGDEPNGLSLERLTKGMPMGCETQRVRFGFHPR
jgi:hypothetical protein